MKNLNIGLLLVFSLLLISSIAGANVTMINNRTSFESLGTIDYNYGFDEYGTGFSSLSNPWTSHGVTYTNSNNVIVGSATGFTTNGTPMMANAINYYNSVQGTIDQNGQYTLFGFDAGYMYYDDNGTVITIGTNINNYTFNVDLNSANNTVFYGFVTGYGEYFKSFNITTNVNFAVPGMDNVTLGDNNGQHSVPEPATMFLLGIGLIGLPGFRRKIKK